MSKRKNINGVYAYLDSSGVLDGGTEEAITQARKKYWQQYKASWRKQKRAMEKEITISWNKEELQLLNKASKQHHTNRTKFIKSATIAYINKAYVVPNELEVRRISQYLAMVYNSIQDMIEVDTIPLQVGKILSEKILNLEHALLVSIRNPKTLDQLIAEAVQNNKEIKEHLYNLLETIP